MLHFIYLNIVKKADGHILRIKLPKRNATIWTGIYMQLQHFFRYSKT